MTDPTFRDPDDWVTGDEPPTAAQQSYLATLAREAGQEVPEHLTKAEASKVIDELRARTGRDAASGNDSSGNDSSGDGSSGDGSGEPA
jgi:Protein of unknown function (DUF3072)